MATVTLPPAQKTEPTQRFLLPNVDWATYEAILKALGDRPGLYVNYDGENLEFMTISRFHEWLKIMMGELIAMLCWQTKIVKESGGSMTFKREDVQRGLEPDQCYWIQNESLVRGMRELDFTVDPPPDLAIEIDVSYCALDRQSIYAELRVPEIWRCNGREIRIFLLQKNGEYEESDTSAAFPFLPVHELPRFLQRDEQTSELALLEAFVDWLHELGLVKN